jgi:hypothetical protein
METLVDYWYGKNRDRNLDLHKAKHEVPTQQISPTTKSQKQIEKKPKEKINKMNNNKKIEEWLTTVTESWAENAKEETFSGMNLAQFKVLTRTSLTERERLDTILRDRRAGIARREAADRKTREYIKMVVHAVLANPDHGPNSALYRAMGYITDDERASGLTRKDDAPDNQPNE